ncbi:MAG: hypothetical protein IIX86_01200 [Clostridia bacterium]|nr:hypothetical protein [Clostridia bacterium]
MLKGAQKKMYVVKMGQDSPFEEAYFVLKRERDAVTGDDMIKEATRIISQSAGQERSAESVGRRVGKSVLLFACGLVTGGGIAGVICWLL